MIFVIKIGTGITYPSFFLSGEPQYAIMVKSISKIGTSTIKRFFINISASMC
jgi:hypothetical protein